MWTRLDVFTEVCMVNLFIKVDFFKEKSDFNVKKKTPFGCLGSKSAASKKLFVLLGPGSSS